MNSYTLHVPIELTQLNGMTCTYKCSYTWKRLLTSIYRYKSKGKVTEACGVLCLFYRKIIGGK